MSPAKALLFALGAFGACGCAHVPPGGAKELKVSFGVPSVFHVEKNVTNLKVDERKIAIGDTTTAVTILLFQWNSSAQGITLTNPEGHKP